MKSRLKIISILFIICMLIWLVLPGPGVPILAYHQVSPADDIYSVTAAQFEEQMHYLREQGYTAISLAELLDSYEGRAVLPDKPIIITFDDGYEDNLLIALPIMEKYKMRCTIFIVSSLVGTPEYLSWQQIADLQAAHTEIGSHTMSHIALGDSSPEQQQREVSASKAMLEQYVGPVKFFAYPYGSFTPITQQILEKAGYLGACSGIAGLNSKGVDVYALKRINIPHPKYGLGEFRLRLLRGHIYSKLGI